MPLLRLLTVLALAMSLALPAAADLELGYEAYERGDVAAARAAWENAAEAGNGEAMHNLGVLYETGDGVAADPARAIEWYRRATEVGVPHSAFNLANMYREGRGVEVDLRRAGELYEKAGSAGHGGALNNLGAMFLSGMGVEADAEIAARLFQLAAENGSVNGLISLAQLREEGIGVDQDPIEAARLYRIAAGTGDESAIAYLPTMRPAVDEALPADASGSALVAQTQRLLGALGYDAGPVDGMMGPQTRSAIEAFAAAEGVRAAGDPTPELRDRLVETLLTPARF